MKQTIFLRKCCAGVLALSCVLATTATIKTTRVTCHASTVSGDINLDGSVSTADAVTLSKYIMKKTTLLKDAYENADINSDGKVNIIDLALLKEQLKDTPVSANTIHLNGTSIESDSSNVVINGTTVTITKSGSYSIDGSMTVDSEIIIQTEETDTDAVEITLNNVSMTNSTDLPCIMVENADKTKVTFTGENTLTNTFDDESASTAVIYAKDDITFTKNSTGTLNVVANSEMGIYCNNDIKFNGGTVNVTTDAAGTKIVEADAVKAKGTVENAASTLTVDASGDGIKSSKTNVVISGGKTTVKAGNDAVQGETDVAVSGGTLVASGDRGITSVGTLTITGGDVFATATDNQAEYTENASTQNIVTLDFATEHKKAESVVFGSNTYTAVKKYSYALISNSSVQNGSYSVYTNGSQMKATEAEDGKFAVASSVSAFTAVDVLEGGETVSDSVATEIIYSESSVTMKNASGAELKTADNVTINGTTATVTQPSDEITVSGQCSSGQLVVDVDKTTYADGKVTLVFNGLELSNTTDSPVYVAAIGDEAVISVKKGTTNTISDGTDYTNADESQGAIYACDDLKIKGKGTLNVNGNQQDAIVCKNDLKIWNGTINVNAVDDGIRGKDSVKIGDPDDTDFSALNITVKSTGGDGIKSSNETEEGEGTVTINGGTINVNAFGDGIQAISDLTVNGGDITVYTYQGSDYTASGSSSSGNTGGFGGMGGGGMQDGNSNKMPDDLSAKGLKSDGTITLNAGTFDIDSSDDSIHAGGDIKIYGGKYNLGSADDAVHSDASLDIGENTSVDLSAIEIYVYKCYEGIEGVTINQNSGVVNIISGDDGYNAAGGSDSSGNNSGNPWQQGGGMSESSGTMNLNGGIVIVQSANGDHDAFDSNGDLNITGGYYCANGQEPMDCGDGYSINHTGGNVITMTAGNTNLSTTYAFVKDGQVVASFVSGSGGSFTYQGDTSITAYSGCTISGGTNLSTLDSTQQIYTSGTVSGGTQITASSGGNQGGNQGGFNGGNQGGFGGF